MKATQLIREKIKHALRSHGLDIIQHKELPEWLHHHGVDLVWDIGANDGRYVSEIRHAGWDGRIASFEPQPSAFRRLEQSRLGDRQWKGYQIGLGSKNTTLPMNIHEMDVLSSFLDPVETINQLRTIDIPVKRADGIFDDVAAGCSRPFVKMDTQGFEMEILQGFGRKISDVTGFQLEMSVKPIYQNQPLMEDVIAFMRNHGFSLWRVLPGLRDPATLQAFEMDGIFFKNS